MLILVLFFGYTIKACARVCDHRRHGYKIILLFFSSCFLCIVRAGARFEVTAKRIKIYTTVSFLSHFGIIVYPSRAESSIKKIHINSFSVLMSCAYFWIFFFMWFFSRQHIAFCSQKRSQRRRRHKNEKMWQHKANFISIFLENLRRLRFCNCNNTDVITNALCKEKHYYIGICLSCFWEKKKYKLIENNDK